MKSVRTTIVNGPYTVERTNNLIAQYVHRQLHGLTLIPEGTTEDRVVAVLDALSKLPMGFCIRRWS